jgi:hypothetical protein
MSNVVLDLSSKLESKYDSKMFLGRLGWYTISENVSHDHGKFCEKILDITDTLPGPPRPGDIFKRACTFVERKNIKIEDNLKVNYMIRPSGSDPDFIWRSLVKEIVDSEGHRLSYEEVCVITFQRKTEVVDVIENRVLEPVETVIIKNLKDYITDNSNVLTAYAIRETVRRILEKSLYAIKVRPSGGIYFVSEEHSERFSKLEDVVNSLGFGASFHSLPLLNDEKQREMLRNAFEEESCSLADELIGEIMGLVKSGKKISSDKFTNYKMQYDSLRKKVVDYSDILDEAMEITASRLEVMNNVMLQLLGNVNIES